jgi:murein DD-endopeptidase MepM/ murein hydrolase activator NlpD
LQNATVRARDALRRHRPDRTPSMPSVVRSLRLRSAVVARGMVSRIDTIGASPERRPVIAHGAHRVTRRERLGNRLGLTPARLDGFRARFTGRERLLPIGVALLVLFGSLSSIAVPAPIGAVGGTHGAGDAPRLAVAGLENGDGAYDSGIGVDGAASDSTGAARYEIIGDAQVQAQAQAQTTEPAAPYLADGTLLKPIAVDTSVGDSAETLRSYRVRSGDTLTGIARHFGVSMMTLWWANHLKSKDSLKVGQKLVIPPVDGTVHVVVAGETLAKIADIADVSVTDVMSFNGLTDQTVTVGETLILPGGHGKPIPTPKPQPPASNGGGGGGGGGGSVPRQYSGGVFAWPLPGGTISQYFHYGHPALDIAAPYGSRIIAAASGTVIFAGWKNNGGGYQVWIAHGSGLFTTYNHMSAITVGNGQHVGRGEQVGRVGATGWATGPHLHFEVWRNEVWGNGYRVNPLGYL